ncbi:MAG: hypothetical protein KGZ66_09640 [Selenomonadales bacterium]|nr:hypothetical protein [Selenomonadales bacterium]
MSKSSPSKGLLIPAVAGVLVIAVAAFIFAGPFGSGRDPYDRGAKAQAEVQTGQDTQVGSTAKTGWQLNVPDGLMERGTGITLRVLSAEETKSKQTSDFVFYGTPLEVAGEGVHDIWFAEPVQVTVKIPALRQKDLAAEELFFATYEDGAWRFLVPDSVNVAEGTAVLRASHFSWLGFGKPSEEAQLRTFAATYAASEHSRLQKKARLNGAVGRQLDELLQSLGVTSRSARDQLVKDAVAYLESAAYDELLAQGNPLKDFAPVDTLVRMTYSAQAGAAGEQEFNDKAMELYAKAIAFSVEKSVNANKAFFAVKDVQTGAIDKTAKAITVLGGLGTAAGAFAGGDAKAGFEAVAGMLTSLSGPKVQLLVSTLNYAKAGIEQAADAAQAYWTQAEIEEAYKMYLDQESGLAGDFQSIFALKGNAEALMNIRIVKAHCEKYGINEADLGSAAREKLITGAWSGLRQYFEERKASEPEIAKLRQSEEAFIAEMKKQGLLSYLTHQAYFGIDKRGSNYDVETRLTRLYAIRNAVLSCIDPDKRAELDHVRLVRAIGVWIAQSEKNDKAGFFAYLRETGMFEEAIKADPTFAWVLVGTVNYDGQEQVRATNKGGVYEVSNSSAPGSYSCTWRYLGKTDTYYDPDVLHGENSTSTATFSVPPSTIRAGEVVSLDMKLSFGSQKLSYFTDKATAGADFDKWDVDIGYITGGAIRFRNKDGKTSFTIDTYKTVKVYSVSETLTAVVPAGKAAGDKIALRTSLSARVTQGTRYIYEWQQTD